MRNTSRKAGFRAFAGIDFGKLVVPTAAYQKAFAGIDFGKLVVPTAAYQKAFAGIDFGKLVVPTAAYQKAFAGIDFGKLVVPTAAYQKAFAGIDFGKLMVPTAAYQKAFAGIDFGKLMVPTAAFATALAGLDGRHLPTPTAEFVTAFAGLGEHWVPELDPSEVIAAALEHGRFPEELLQDAGLVDAGELENPLVVVATSVGAVAAAEGSSGLDKQDFAARQIATVLVVLFMWVLYLESPKFQAAYDFVDFPAFIAPLVWAALAGGGRK